MNIYKIVHIINYLERRKIYSKILMSRKSRSIFVDYVR